MPWKSSNKKSQQKTWIPERLRLLFKVGLIVSILAFVVFSAGTAYYYHKASQYDIEQVARQQQHNILLDHNGLPLLGSKSRQETLITGEDLPQHLVDALIAREDASFETHPGIDIKGLIRATVRNIKDMSFTQGASTLTMQLARNTYDIRAKSLNRKFLEIALTLRIEKHYSKPEIMAYYLNCIYFGSGCYGIEQAAQKYFKKSTKDLDLSESATLIGIIRGPHIFSPLNDIKAAERERNQVLDRMVAIGKLGASEAQSIQKNPLALPSAPSASAPNIAPANGYALNALNRHLNEILSHEDIRRAGLTIRSTLDLALLKKCETDLKELTAISKNAELQTSCVVLNHQTGAIHALIGGVNHTTSPLNRALDGQMELGDAFTPFVYAAALERGKLPIKNNPVQTGRQLRSNDMLDFAQRFGFGSRFNTHEIFKGRGMASPLQLATAFATLANQGKRPHTYFIQSISQQNGDTIFNNGPHTTQAIQKGTATETLKLLRNKNGTHQYTTSAFKGKALWSIAANKKFTTVLWVGFDQPQTIPDREKYYSTMNKLTYDWVN